MEQVSQFLDARDGHSPHDFQIYPMFIASMCGDSWWFECWQVVTMRNRSTRRQSLQSDIELPVWWRLFCNLFQCQHSHNSNWDHMCCLMHLPHMMLFSTTVSSKLLLLLLLCCCPSILTRRNFFLSCGGRPRSSSDTPGGIVVFFKDAIVPLRQLAFLDGL